MNDEASQVGQRVRYWRQRRDLDRKQFADMVGRSTSWLDKVEKGERNLLRLPMLERVAEALSINPSVLIDATTARAAAECADAVEVQAIRKALGRYDMLTTEPSRHPLPTLRRMQQQLDYIGHAWLSSHFTTVGQVLPQLIRDAQAVAAQADEASRPQAQRALVDAYHRASSMLLKYDSTEIAWLAADRAMHTAHASEDTLALARATRSVARAMSHTGQLDESATVSTDMADLLRPQLSGSDRDIVPLFGMLLLSAEITTASQGNSSLTRELHDEALAATHWLGPDHRGHDTVFGATNVHVHHVAALVRLHEGSKAVRHAESIDPTLITDLPLERRSNFLLDLTEAYVQTGHYRAAIDMLTNADQLAPQEVRCRPLAHRLITGLLSTALGGSDPGLRRIARHASVTA